MVNSFSKIWLNFVVVIFIYQKLS